MNEAVIDRIINAAKSGSASARDEVAKILTDLGLAVRTGKAPGKRAYVNETIRSYEEAVRRAVTIELEASPQVRALRAAIFDRLAVHLKLTEEQRHVLPRPQEFRFPVATCLFTPTTFAQQFISAIAREDEHPIPGARRTLQIKLYEPLLQEDHCFSVPASDFFLQLLGCCDDLKSVLGVSQSHVLAMVLTGWSPELGNAIECRFTSNERCPALSRIVLSVDPRCRKEDVAELYASVRKSVAGERARPKSEISLDKFRVRHGTEGWESRFDLGPPRTGLWAASQQFSNKQLSKTRSDLFWPKYGQLSGDEPTWFDLILPAMRRATIPLAASFFHSHGTSYEEVTALNFENLVGRRELWIEVAKWFFDWPSANARSLQIEEIVDRDDFDGYHSLSSTVPALRAMNTANLQWQKIATFASYWLSPMPDDELLSDDEFLTWLTNALDESGGWPDVSFDSVP